jgi:hypothetical protein
MPYKDQEKARAYDAAYQAAHREEKRAYDAAHREEKRAYNAAHRATNKQTANLFQLLAIKNAVTQNQAV